MFKFLLFAIAAYALYKLFANDFFKKKKMRSEEEKAEMERKVECGEMVKDPECGTWVDVDSSISVRDGESVYYFCSYECRDRFLKRLQSGGAALSNTEKNGD